MAKQPLDLYKLFKLVVERGGLVEVSALASCHHSPRTAIHAFLNQELGNIYSNAMYACTCSGAVLLIS